MNYTVSVSDFRKDMSKFYGLVNMGKTVTVNNGKSGVPLFKIVKADEGDFDWDEYMKFIEKLGGSGFLSSNTNIKSMNEFRNSFNKRFEEARNR